MDQGENAGSTIDENGDQNVVHQADQSVALESDQTSPESPPEAPRSVLEQALNVADWRPKRLLRRLTHRVHVPLPE